MKNFEAYFDNNIFAFDGEKNILIDEHIGIASDIASILTPYSSAAALKCFQGIPYTCTPFDLDVRINGEKIDCTSWKWLPCAVLRNGKTPDFTVKTLTAIVPQSRTVIIKLTVRNDGAAARVPLTVMYRGLTRFEESWTFPIPKFGKLPRLSFTDEDGILSLTNEGASLRLTCSLEGMRLFDRAYLWENDIELPKNGELTFFISAHIGEERSSLNEAKYAKGHYTELIGRAFDYLDTESARIRDNLPRLESSSPELDRLYYRSLVTYILCRWDNPALCARPYYSTGSINGSCMCSYLWDYCGGLMMHPIYDPDGNKIQLRAYLNNDLTSSYALNPVTAGAVGPWYQINQEKIILMVYHHVRATGDKSFLNEIINGRTVVDWMRHYAYVCDDTSKEAELYDYGVGGDDHLELKAWDNGPYNGIMPDLNARRYMNYMRAYELTKLAGCPDEELPKRAEALKEKLKSLWNEKERWYDFIDADGNRDIRFTVQMYKFIASGVIGKHERDGLVSHLNEREFLSKFGLHSLSKADPQYDQDDIDNGGGGICTHFTMQICAQLYEMGYDTEATDILRRVYWWGERLPYLGDSCASNMIMNRNNTPLQGDISSVSAAQMIFFFIFGITPSFDGSITVCPVKNRPADNMKIENAHLCGKHFSVDIKGSRYTVTCGGESFNANIGEAVTI